MTQHWDLQVTSDPPLPPARPESGADERPRRRKKQHGIGGRGEGARAAGGEDARARGRRRRRRVAAHGLPAFQGRGSLLLSRAEQILGRLRLLWESFENPFVFALFDQRIVKWNFFFL